MLERKIVEKNESFRKTLASKIYQVHQQIDKDLTQISMELNTTVSCVQDISHNQLEVNDNLVMLSTKLPFANLWVNSFISGVDLISTQIKQTSN